MLNIEYGGDFMIYPSIDKLLKQVGSKFLLVNIVSKRVNEMEETEDYQLKNYKSTKNIIKALEEIEKDLIHIKEKKDIYEKKLGKDKKRK